MTEIRESGWQGSKAESLGHRVVGRVTNGVLNWWESAGPKRVEDQWVQAHQRVLDAIPDEDERKEAFRLSAERWRKIGGVVGATSTAVDFSLGGVGLWLSTRHPEEKFHMLRRSGSTILHLFDRVTANARMYPNLDNRFYTFMDNVFNSHVQWPGIGASEEAMNAYRTDHASKDHQRRIAGHLFSFIPGLGALATYSGMGPAHAVGALAARVAEGNEKRAFKAKK